MWWQKRYNRDLQKLERRIDRLETERLLELKAKARDSANLYLLNSLQFAFGATLTVYDGTPEHKFLEVSQVRLALAKYDAANNALYGLAPKSPPPPKVVEHPTTTDEGPTNQ